MTNQQIITLVLSSSLISAFFTKVLDFWVNSINYKRDFYKKIIEKRIAAYDELQKTIYPATIRMLCADGKKAIGIYSDMQNYSAFVKSFLQLKNHSSWYSQKTNKSIGLLVGFIANEKKGGVDINTSDARLEQLGKDNYLEVAKLIAEVLESAAIDFKNLHKVRRFLGSKTTFYFN